MSRVYEEKSVPVAFPATLCATLEGAIESLKACLTTAERLRAIAGLPEMPVEPRPKSGNDSLSGYAHNLAIGLDELREELQQLSNHIGEPANFEALPKKHGGG